MQRGWLPGQMADLVADPQGPQNLIRGLHFTWSTQGNVVRAITGDETNHRLAVQVAASDGGGPGLPLPSGSGMSTGTSQKEFTFVWARIADNGPDSDPVTLSATGGDVSVKPVTTTFLVTPPVVSNTLAQVGTAGIDAGQHNIGLYNAPNNSAAGVTFQAQVTLPNGFGGSGAWRYLQKANINQHITIFSPQFNQSQGQHFKGNNFWWLDNVDDYWPRVNPDGSLAVNAVGAPSFWTTGAQVFKTTDGPALGLDAQLQSDPKSYMTEATYVGMFRMFIMFRPPGAGSQWVAVSEADWGFNIAVTRSGPTKAWAVPSGYTTGQTNNPQPTFQIPQEVPQWTDAVTNPPTLVPD
jgi:hypothetical protein